MRRADHPLFGSPFNLEPADTFSCMGKHGPNYAAFEVVRGCKTCEELAHQDGANTSYSEGCIIRLQTMGPLLACLRAGRSP